MLSFNLTLRWSVITGSGTEQRGRERERERDTKVAVIRVGLSSRWVRFIFVYLSGRRFLRGNL